MTLLAHRAEFEPSNIQEFGYIWEKGPYPGAQLDDFEMTNKSFPIDRKPKNIDNKVTKRVSKGLEDENG